MKIHHLTGDLSRGGMANQSGYPEYYIRHFTRDDCRTLNAGSEWHTIIPEFGERFIIDPEKPPHTLGRTYPELTGDRGRRRDEPEACDRFREFAFEFDCRAAEPPDVLHADKRNTSWTHDGEVAYRAGL